MAALVGWYKVEIPYYTIKASIVGNKVHDNNSLENVGEKTCFLASFLPDFFFTNIFRVEN